MKNSRFNKLGRWLKKVVTLRFLLITTAVFVVLAGIGLVAAKIILYPYEKKAEGYDLAEIRKVETASVVYDRNGDVLGSLFAENRRPIPVEQLPDSLIHAVMATEDSRFFDHCGIDLIGMTRAMITNLKRGGISQGASTITQQLARQTFEMREISYERKLTEIFLALRIEEQYTKAEIFQHYLNLIYFGNGFYGIESAALGYFGKPASDLSLGESATLAALIKRPNAYNPFDSLDLTKAARNRTLKRMRANGYIDKRTYLEAIDTPVSSLDPSLRNGKGLHVMGEIRRRLSAIFEDQVVSLDGCQVYTSIDLKLEQTLRRKVSLHLAAIEQAPGNEAGKGSKQPLEVAVTMISNDTGELLASVGGRNFGRSEFDRAFNARRMMGTAFTPFVYAAAIEGGLDPYAEVLDAPLDNSAVMIGATEGIIGEWGAEDFDNQYEGPISAWKAIVSSKNAATVRVASNLKVDPVLALLDRAGFPPDLRAAPSTILGQTEVTPAELTLSYSSFPNGGKRPEKITIIRKVVDGNGDVLYENTGTSRQVEVMQPLTAGYVHSALVGALEKGTGESSVNELGLIHMPAGGKTGTAYNFTDAWFLGYNSAVTCGVWVGYDRPEPIGEGAFGSVLALPIWVDAMNASFEEFPPDQIEPAPGTGRAFVCDYTGMAKTEFCAHKRFVPGSNQPVMVSCTHRANLPLERLQNLQPCSKHSAASIPEGTKMLTSLQNEATQRMTGPYAPPVYPRSAALIGKDPFGSLVAPERPTLQAVPVKAKRRSPWRFERRVPPEE